MNKFDIACIIDDDPIFIFGTKKLMQLNDFCNGSLVFNNGLDAINYLRPLIENNGKVPDIIFLDLNMPIMDGWEFLDEFTRIPVEQKIIVYIVSSSIDPSDIKRAQMYKTVSNYIIKPITQQKLRQILDASNV